VVVSPDIQACSCARTSDNLRITAVILDAGRRETTFTNPLVYAFGGEHGYTPAIMTLSKALADG
jgi:hypothetical protein